MLRGYIKQEGALIHSNINGKIGETIDLGDIPSGMYFPHTSSVVMKFNQRNL